MNRGKAPFNLVYEKNLVGCRFVYEKRLDECMKQIWMEAGLHMKGIWLGGGLFDEKNLDRTMKRINLDFK